MLALGLHTYEPPKVPAPPAFRPASSARDFQCTTIDRRYTPGRGLTCSLTFHALFICTVFFILPGERPKHRIPEQVTFINLRDPNYRLFLPMLWSGAPSSAPEEPVEGKPAPPQSPKPKGLTYPGPQTIISDFPEPTNQIQTLLQPLLTNPPVVAPPLLLPNIVRAPAIRLVMPPPAPKPPDPVPAAALKPADLPMRDAKIPIKAPTIAVPAAAAQAASVTETKPPEPSVRTNATPPTPAAPPDPPDAPPAIAAASPAKTGDPLVALTPMPSSSSLPLQVPLGEARGRFMISPDSNLQAPDAQPGAPVAAASPAPAAASASKNGPATAGTSISATGNGPAGNGSEGARDRKDAPAGANAGKGSANGANRGDGFPGITILGGMSENGPSNNIISIGGGPVPLQTSYGITIVSTESAGGGLPAFGVFSNEEIYTVYLDMRKSVNDSSPAWTFEYAVARKPPVPDSSQNTIRMQQGLVLPFPVTKEQPAFPADLLRRYAGLRMVIYAIINADGKMDQITIKDSPDPMLNEPVTKALRNWTFKPAQLEGEKVAVKALIGIPLSFSR